MLPVDRAVTVLGADNVAVLQDDTVAVLGVNDVAMLEDDEATTVDCDPVAFIYVATSLFIHSLCLAINSSSPSSWSDIFEQLRAPTE